MKPLISDSLKLSLVAQMGHEIYNAHIYLYVAAYLNSKGLSNLAKHFEGQNKEEIEHSLILYNLLTDLGVAFDMPEIPPCNMPFNMMSEISTLYLEREFLTTSNLDDIKKQSILDSNPVVEEKLREMISKQQHEYREATDMFDKASILTEWWQVSLWDMSMEG